MALSVLLVTAVVPARADASHVGCGDVLTENTTLHNDVGPCTGDGLLVAADHVRVDLNGHRVFGTPEPGDGAGILLRERTGVQVVGGTVSDFDAGVAIVGGSGNTVRGVTARDNIGQANLPHVGVEGTDYGDGIAILSSTDNRILDNNVVHNGPYSGIGLFQMVDSDHPREITGPTENNLLRGNRVVGNDVCRVDPGDPVFPPGFCDNDGIRLEPGVSRNKVIGNEVRGSALDGIALFSRNTTHNEVKDNVVEGNGFHGARHRKGDGIRLFGQARDGTPGANHSLVTANQVFDNAANGIRVDARFNKILGNKTGGNDAVPDERFGQFDLHDSNPECDQNRWRGNTYDTAQPECTTP